MKKLNPENAACLGASTKSVRTTEHMEECRTCKTRVRFDMVNHPFWGFKSTCYRLLERSKGEAVK